MFQGVFAWKNKIVAKCLLYGVSMWNDFVLLFTDMGTISLILIICGIILMAVEICVPGFGIFGILGIGSLFGAVISRAIEGANITQVCIMIILCLLAVSGMVALLSRSMRKGLLSKTGLVETGKVVKPNYISPKESLVGKIGKTTCACRPAGSVEIEGQIYDCMSTNSYVGINKSVEVLQIKDEIIIVKDLEEKE